MSTSQKDPKALTRGQFGILLGVLAVCIALALLTMAGVAGSHGTCPTETQTSRPGNPQCHATYVNLDETGVIGIQAK